jgi:hypothetical protein
LPRKSFAAVFLLPSLLHLLLSHSARALAMDRREGEREEREEGGIKIIARGFF